MTMAYIVDDYDTTISSPDTLLIYLYEVELWANFHNQSGPWLGHLNIYLIYMEDLHVSLMFW